MKNVKTLVAAVLFISLVTWSASYACVGKTLFLGVTHSQSEMLLAEMISVLVSERTGTTVKIVQYSDARTLYAAVKKGDVGIIIENTDRAAGIIGKAKERNPRSAYESLKKEYRRALNLVWLDPIGGTAVSAPVISVETLSNLPALPKLINKLSNSFNEETYNKVMKLSRSDEKPKKIARDFLKSKKLI